MQREALHITQAAERRRLWLYVVQLDLLHDIAAFHGRDRAAYRWATLGVEASERYMALCRGAQR